MRFLSILLFSIFIYSTGFSQDMQVSSSEKFNKRGFYKNSSAALDGNEIISDYDGNLMMSYSTNLDLPAGMSGDLSIMYNANVEHKAFWRVDQNSAGYSINVPEWIIGFRGYAVQTLNFETNLFIEDASGPNTTKISYYGEEAPLLIPGYHFGNSTTPIAFGHYDVITILKTDGSKVVLENVAESSRSGFYKEVGKGAHGIAIVTPKDVNGLYRNVYYKPGDGTTFVFEEQPTNYNGINQSGFAMEYYVPKALYLVEFRPNDFIWSRTVTTIKNGTPHTDTLYTHNYLQFNYTDLTSHDQVTYGRKLFSGITWVAEGASYNQLDLDYYYDRTNLINICINNYNKDDKLVIDLYGQGQTSLFRSERDRSGSRIARIKSIKDKLNRTDNFTYFPIQPYPLLNESENKVLRNYKCGNGSGVDLFRLYCQAGLLSKVAYFSKKTTCFDYYHAAYDSTKAIPFLDFNLSPQRIQDNVDLAYRDCYTNFMIKRHEIYNNFQGNNSLVKREEYSYYVDDPNYQKSWISDHIDSIKTKIEEYSGTDLNNVYRKTIKNYSNYRCDYFDKNSLDRSYTLKLMSETVQGMLGGDDNKIIEKKYTYDNGSRIQFPSDPNSNYWTGTFDSKSITETDKDLQNSGNSVKTTTISTTYQNATFRYVLSGVIRDVVIPLKVAEKVKDSNSLWKCKKLLNLIPQIPFYERYGGDSYYRDNDFYFYQIGLTAEEKDSLDTGTVLNVTINDYYIPTGSSFGNFAGKLKKTTRNYQAYANRWLYTNYSYDTGEMSLGLLSSIQNDKGVLQNYYYPKNIYDNYLGMVVPRDTAYGYIVQYNGTRTWSPFIQTGFQIKPFKTLTIYSNTQGINDTLITYSAYNPNGTLKFDVDANKNYSEYAYDNLGRLVAAAFPMSFVYPTTPFGLNSTIYCFDSYTSDNPSGTSFPMMIYKEYHNGGGTVSGTNSVSSNKTVSSTSNDKSGNVSPNSTWDPDPSYDRYNYFYCSLGSGVDRTKTILKAVLKFSILCDENNPVNPMALDIWGINSSGALVGSMIDGYPLPSDLGNVYKEIQVDVTSLVQNSSLYGFKIAVSMQSDPQNQTFAIKSQPVLFVSYNVPGAQAGEPIDKQPNTTGYIVYSYDDINNTVTEKRRVNPDPANLQEVVARQDLDGLGQVRIGSTMKDNIGNYETKSIDTYTIDGKNLNHTDGENRTVTNSYDFLQRPVFQTNGDNSFKKTDYFFKTYTISNGSYTASYTDYTKSVDEAQKEVYTYYDKVGNKVAEKVGTNPPTIFQYDSFYRLYKVISPNQSVRTYSYDEIGNLKQKDSPSDEGTTYYKFDKDNRLRFSMNSAAPSGERGITFTKYDQFGRVLATGTLPSNYGWTTLVAETDYSVNRDLPHFENYQADTANFVTVNMYDKYTKSGIFASMPDPFWWSPNDANSSRNLRGHLVLTAFRDKPGQGWNYRIYLYDYFGRANYIYQKIGNAPWKYIFKETDVLGNQKRELLFKISGGSSVYEHATWNNYDKEGRLWEVRSDPAGNYTNSKQEASYTYNKADQVSTLTYSQVTNANKTTTYSYSNTRGWLGRILNGSNNFCDSLSYYPNGNIQTQLLTNSVLGGLQTLSYGYDAMNRLASVLQNGSTRESFQYDYVGNISQRNYLSGGSLKSSTYLYDGNRLNALFTFEDEFDYYYDERGNVKMDPYTGINDISYDQRNLPLSMTTSTNSTYKYRYDDAGNRIYKDAQGSKEYYLRDDIGREFAVYDVTTDRLKMINLYGSDLIGRIDVSWNYSTRSDARKFYVKDHLGSIRQTLNESGVVTMAMDYYAFGGTMSSYVNGSTVDKYKFTGKERDQETGLDYFGARYYDSKIGRWMSVDPLAEKYPGWSPYNYALNNPLLYIDPDGQVVGGPGILFGIAGGMEIVGGALISAGIAATAIIGPNKVGQGMQDAGEWIQGQAGKIVDGVTGNDFKSTPYPVTQIDGMNYTTISQADATNVNTPGRSGTTIGKQNGVTIESYGTNDEHKPAHAHVLGGGQEVRIGQNGKPLKGQPELTTKQSKVVKKFKKQIRKEIKKVGKENENIQKQG